MPESTTAIVGRLPGSATSTELQSCALPDSYGQSWSEERCGGQAEEVVMNRPVRRDRETVRVRELRDALRLHLCSDRVDDPELSADLSPSASPPGDATADVAAATESPGR